MRLLLSLTSYPPAVGGAQLLMHQLARELNQRHHVQVAAQWDTIRTDWLLGTTLRAPREVKDYQADGVAVRRLALAAPQQRRLAPWVLAYYALQGPAIDRISAALADQLAPLAASADLIHNCRIGREGLSYASLRAARQRDVPFVLTPVHHPRWGGWLHRHYHRLYRQADAVVALTEAERRILAGLGVAENHTFVTGMGPVLAAEADPVGFRREHRLGSDPIVLFLGQKYAYKGVDALLKAAPGLWQRVPEARLAFIGPRTAYSRRRFETVREARVLELDTVDLQTKTDALAACDVLCVPSTQESFGGVYTEAWSLGKPVVAADIPALREVVTDGQDGRLVPPEPLAIADCLSELLLHPVRAAALGARGQAKVRERFSWPRLAELTENVYHQITRVGTA